VKAVNNVDDAVLQLTAIDRLMSWFGPLSRGGFVFRRASNLTILHDKKSEFAFANEPISSVPMRLLAPDEPRAPTVILSLAKRAALIACLADGTLCKQRGVWTSPRDTTFDRRIAGITVADLVRDGMFTVNVIGRRAVAQLTVRGSWFARTIASPSAEA